MIVSMNKKHKTVCAIEILKYKNIKCKSIEYEMKVYKYRNV